MEAAEYERMAEVQDRHWWFEAKRRTVAALLDRFDAVDPGGGRALEVGVGTGSMVRVMGRAGRLFAADAYLPALRLLSTHRPRGVEVVAVGADLARLPFADRNFSLIGCFDVLYHQNVGDVDRALEELFRVCRPGGHLAITDSAFASLRSAHDVATHAARRFRLADLTAPLEAAGFEVVHSTYFHTLLFPVAAALRLTKRLVHGAPRLESGARDVAAVSDLTPVPAWLNAVLLALYRLETPLAARLRLPFGVSLLILARRPLTG